MRSETKSCPPIIRFPGAEVTPSTEAEREIADEHDFNIHELCSETSQALRELRHGIKTILPRLYPGGIVLFGGPQRRMSE
jgi:hypothetical protein